MSERRRPGPAITRFDEASTRHRLYMRQWRRRRRLAERVDAARYRERVSQQSGNVSEDVNSTESTTQ